MTIFSMHIRDLKEIRETLKMAYPIIIGQLGHMMMGVVDSVMVGKIGAAPLAASAVAHGIFMLFMIFGIGVSMALSPLTAISRGAGNFQACGIVFRQGLLVNLITGLILSVITFFAARIINYLNQPAEIVDQGIGYMEILAFSVIPVMIFQTGKQFSEGLSVMRPAMVITLLANTVNIFGNWVFIYGNLGFPAMGLRGAGWATFCTRFLMGLSFLLYVLRAERFRPFEANLRFHGLDRDMIKKILKIGIPGGLQYFFEVGAFVGSAIIIGWLGTNELAAHQIAINLASISFMCATGISAAAGIRVGYAVGRKNIDQTRQAGMAAFMLAGAVMGTFAVIFILFRFFLPALYIDNGGVIQIAANLLIIAALFQISDGTQAVGIGVLRGLADAKMPMIITFIAYWIIGLPGGYLLGFILQLGVIGIWISLFIALSVSALLLTLRFFQKSRQAIDI
jgi:MATE family multidrug resistance protein